MSDSVDMIYPVILCGGTGTRLWPASRESMPKQFARLVDAERSTFQATLVRVSDTAVFAKPTVIASAEARFIVAEQCSQLGIGADILLEPQGRDSAAAVAVAALYAAAIDSQAVVLIMAADHVVPNTRVWLRNVVGMRRVGRSKPMRGGLQVRAAVLPGGPADARHPSPS
ncbi:sugar phosphate nucleotidyltransferase, partial [Methylobacterium mesophilicum]